MARPSGTLITQFILRGRPLKIVQVALDKAKRQVANEMVAAIRSTIQIPYPPASVPGEPPHRRSGRLTKSVRIKATKAGLNVRTVSYGFYLEGGTSNMAPRPFIRPVLFDEGARVKWQRRISQLARRYAGRK